MYRSQDMMKKLNTSPGNLKSKLSSYANECNFRCPFRSLPISDAFCLSSLFIMWRNLRAIGCYLKSVMRLSNFGLTLSCSPNNQSNNCEWNNDQIVYFRIRWFSSYSHIQMKHRTLWVSLIIQLRQKPCYVPEFKSCRRQSPSSQSLVTFLFMATSSNQKMLSKFYVLILIY